MNWIKIGTVNIIVLIFAIFFIEIISGSARLFLGKDFKLPGSEIVKIQSYVPSHPCLQMKTDTLLSHSHYNGVKCKINGGKALNEYVFYNSSQLDKPVLLTLGGSTTDGFYQQISSGETYPKHLALLARDNFFLLNGGTGAYSSLQELYKFIRDGSRIQNLKLVVSLNGLNELPNYHGENKNRRLNYPFLTEIQNIMNEKQIWIDQRVEPNFWEENLKKWLPNIYSLFAYLKHKYILMKMSKAESQQPPISSSKEKLKLVNSKEVNKEFFFVAVDAADRWEKNVTRLNSLVKLEGARYYLFLQPGLGLKGPQSQPKIGSYDEHLYKFTGRRGYRKKIRLLYAELKDRCSKLSFCYDISDKVPPTGSVYHDPRHHNAKGNKILASEIWKIIQKNN